MGDFSLDETRNVEAFQREILDWYRVHRRELPWRGDRDAYRILVSEVMLQQTQVDRVKPKYLEFLRIFPNLRTLARASTADVLRVWQGLGYNRRALNLKSASEIIVRDHGGEVPESLEVLESLPGIGRYTARAIASFAFNQRVAVVDTNVRRVLSSFAGYELQLAEAQTLADDLLPEQGAAEWNQALMDFGALNVRRTRPRQDTSSEPFSTTNRFWRGRIVDALRSSERLSLQALLDSLPQSGQDELRVRSLVRTLHEEGLVDYNAAKDEVRLPA